MSSRTNMTSGPGIGPDLFFANPVYQEDCLEYLTTVPREEYSCYVSELMYREWRICYSLAELHLMRNFNEIQLKVYILLKKISKSILNPVCKDMTSYIMKNIVFWVCERNGVGRFTEVLLMDRLVECIIYLKKSIIETNLPSYMIPDRNLLAGRLDFQMRQRLTIVLNNLLHEGGRMLLRCDKLRDAMLVMYKVPDMFTEFSEKRDKVESMMLMIGRMCFEINQLEMSLDEQALLLSEDEQFNDIWRHTFLLIQFVFQALIQGKLNMKSSSCFP